MGCLSAASRQIRRRAADALAIPGAQRPEGQRGDDGQTAQGHKSAMQSRDDREAVGLRQISKIPRRHQRSEGNAAAHGDLLKRAGYRARHARFIRLDVRIGHAIHAGKLQRIEKSQSEANGYNLRQRRLEADGQADHYRVDDQIRKAAGHVWK
jgi:hypothetical protein